MSTTYTDSGGERTQQRLTHTVEEAGDMLGIGRSAAYQAARRGQIPTVRIGRRLLVPRHKLEQMLGLQNDDGPAGNRAEVQAASDGSHAREYR